MPRENWSNFIKKAVITALCGLGVSAAAGIILMLLNHDKMIALIDYKVTVLMDRIAPDASKTPPTAVGVANK